jgi:uncharacterized membrane protein
MFRNLTLQIGVLRKPKERGCTDGHENRKTILVADNHYRSLIKAFSWRMTGTLDTILISFLITGRIRWALSIGFVELFTKVALYYLHERIWNRLSFGRKPTAGDYEI